MTSLGSSSNNSGTSSSAQTAQEIKSLLQQLRKSQKRRNRGAADQGSDHHDALRLDKLRRIFAQLAERNEFDVDSGDSGATASSQWRRWLKTQHDAFIAHLLEGVAAGRTTGM